MEKQIRKNPKLANCQKYFDSEPGCQVAYTTSEIIKERLNASMEARPCPMFDSKSNFKWTPLYICERNIPTTLPDNFSDYVQPLISSFVQRGFYLIYCIPKAEYDRPSWSWIVSPFDTPIWLTLVTCSIIFGAVGRRIAMIFDAMNFFIYISLPKFKHWKHPALFLSLTLTSFLSYHYEAFMTTSITAPLQLHVFTSIKEALDHGFRLVVSSPQVVVLLKAHVGENIAKQVGRNVSFLSVIIDPEIDQVAQPFKITWRDKLASIKGTIYIYDHRSESSGLGVRTPASGGRSTQLFLEAGVRGGRSTEAGVRKISDRIDRRIPGLEYATFSGGRSTRGQPEAGVRMAGRRPEYAKYPIYVYDALAYKLRNTRVFSQGSQVLCFLIKRPIGPFTCVLNSFGTMTASWFLQNFDQWSGPEGIFDMFRERFYTTIARKLAKDRFRMEKLLYGGNYREGEIKLGLLSNFGILFLYWLFCLGYGLGELNATWSR
ncbi:hypothetical protein Fcan01_18982 [Folsomia candida]|uniref:Uncharacterized protein n=1 Tax=Folsomia candida TaxID=158441 RepID=A0A226DMM0_FOLCA|nr:hypothetical protein Fcan01_18982 [Folsomia candida]